MYVKKTGGGSYNPVLTDADHQVLSILDNQIRPDENPYDDAAAYFGDSIPIEEPINDVAGSNYFRNI
ncbi:unnamed protein product [Leptidea sinapis]|uniref:Uncharacterized protein n=1 Tax=Leptidea sinapis TaxID=189913 RepID=A0A5E4QV85_9NEOP|nr:unnamed protein product [Leptidea sinapis]